MEANEIKINQDVKVTLADGVVKQGKVKGLFEDAAGNVNVTVEYLMPTRKDFAINKVESV